MRRSQVQALVGASLQRLSAVIFWPFAVLVIHDSVCDLSLFCIIFEISMVLVLHCLNR
ncbi:hypothetical protein IWW34DRAFT_719762 [Fusarium oxysporum f. sp. albedinis]|nr:hypothetical protein IWW34DRAFT_719762 [Fusarium oxysporum f. sp. albedinis]